MVTRHYARPSVIIIVNRPLVCIHMHSKLQCVLPSHYFACMRMHTQKYVVKTACRQDKIKYMYMHTRIKL